MCIAKMNSEMKQLRNEGRKNEITLRTKELYSRKDFFSYLISKMNVYYEMGSLLYNHTEEEKFKFNDFKKCW
jgi:hypothetical protein